MGIFGKSYSPGGRKRSRVTENNTSYNRKGGSLRSVTKTVTNNGTRNTINTQTGRITRRTKI